MSLVMLQHVVPGEWGLLVRRIGEAAGLTLPVLVILGLPLVFGASHLFPWARGGEEASNAVIGMRRPWMSGVWVLVRAAIYFAIWILMAWRLAVLSVRLDRTSDARTFGKLARLSAPGMVVYFVTMSMASVDWIMSREAHWYSTVFGFIVTMAQGLAALGFVILIVTLLAKDPPMDTAARPDLLHDLGNLLLLMVILWAYMSFAQLLVIWLGNTQEEIPWYVHRSKGVWRVVTILLVVFQFFGPFILLLLQAVKRSLAAMRWVAVGILVLQWMNWLWMIGPSSPTSYPHPPSWLDFVTPLAIGGVWFAAFLWILKRRPLLPVGLRVVLSPARPDLDHGNEFGTSPRVA
jgi:hypothetical protein